jgi:hypothetical protein
MITFSENDHVYTHKKTGKKLKGWTSLIKRYSKEFNKEEQLIRSAYKIFLGDSEYNNSVKNEFKRLYDLDEYPVADFLQSIYGNAKEIEKIKNELNYDWTYSSINGSIFHKNEELKAFENGYVLCPFNNEEYKVINFHKEYDNQSLCDNLYDLEDGFYPELLVWDNSMEQECTVVTQIDRCYIKTIKKERFVSVDDIKTNKRRPVADKKNKLLPPLDGYYDNNVDKYKLQVQFGGKLMSTFGFKPLNFCFTHYLNYNIDNKKIYNTNYDKETMDNFQKEWKNS